MNQHGWGGGRCPVNIPLASRHPGVVSVNPGEVFRIECKDGT